MNNEEQINEWTFFKDKIFDVAKSLGKNHLADVAFQLGCLYSLARDNSIKFKGEYDER